MNRAMRFSLVAALFLFACCGGAQNKDSYLKKGSLAPDFTHKDQNGNTLKLSEIVKKGPVILTFLRSFF